jgi:hypothetical protein
MQKITYCIIPFIRNVEKSKIYRDLMQSYFALALGAGMKNGCKWA